MNRNLKIIFSCLIIIFLIILIISYLGHLLDPAYTEEAINAIKAFHSLDKNSLEVIIYGSSHAWKGCDPMEMYKKYGLAAYNYGCNWQKINTTLLFLKDSLRTQKPKVVCIDTYTVDTILENTNLNGEIYYTRAISNFDGKKEYLQQCFGTNIERYISYYVPLIMFHDNWNSINSENYTKPNIEKYIKTMGYNKSNVAKVVSIEDYKKFPQKTLSNDSINILDEIVNICEENDINLIFYTCPYANVYSYYEAMEKYEIGHNCKYLNLFQYIDDIGLNVTTDFRDGGHLNDSGSIKVADFLGEYIINNYDVTDMRTVKNNMWEQNLK